MFSFVLGLCSVLSSESIDAIKIRGGSSCSNGSCSGSISSELKKSEKIEVVKKEELKKNTCQTTVCGSVKSKFKVFKNRCR